MVKKTVKALVHPDMFDPSILSRIAERLKRELAAEKVIVYGSVARGEATVHSDIDLLVVAPSQEQAYLRMARAHEVVRDLSHGLPISPLVLTPEEVRECLKAGDAFVQEILETGVEL